MLRLPPDELELRIAATTALAACPFCGRHPLMVTEQNVTSGLYVAKVFCSDCYVSMSSCMETRHHSDQRLDLRVVAMEAELAKLKAEKRKLVKAAKAAASALDVLMGDSDLDDDDSPEFKACQRMNRVLDEVTAKV